MADRVILDTAFLVDMLRKKGSCLRLAQELEDKGLEFYTTAVNAYELHLGALKLSKVKETEELLEDLEVLPLTIQASVASADLQFKLSLKGESLEHRDALIAGTALANNITAIVSNDVDFQRIEQMGVQTY